MSDAPEKHEKIFDPTPRRLQQAKDDGQVCKSKEVGTAAMVLAIGVGVVMTGQDFIATLTLGAREAFMRSPEAAVGVGPIVDVFTTYIGQLAWSLTPLVAIVLLVAVMSNVGQTGLVFSMKALQPKWSNLNPFKKMKEL